MSKPRKASAVTEAQINGIIEGLEARQRRRQPADPPRWWPAIEIADAHDIGVGRTHERRRRLVRKIMRQIRERRHDLISSLAGYAFASSAADLAEDRERRRRSALSTLHQVGEDQRSEATADADGQFRMFGGGPGSALAGR